MLSDTPPLPPWQRQAQLAPVENSQVPGSSQIICTQKREKKKERKKKKREKNAFPLRQLPRDGGAAPATASTSSDCGPLSTPSSRASPRPARVTPQPGRGRGAGGSAGPIPGSEKIPGESVEPSPGGRGQGALLPPVHHGREGVRTGVAVIGPEGGDWQEVPDHKCTIRDIILSS